MRQIEQGYDGVVKEQIPQQKQPNEPLDARRLGSHGDSSNSLFTNSTLSSSGEDVILQLSLRSFSVIFQKDNIHSVKHSADKMASQ
jgi:hypothetical protein